MEIKRGKANNVKFLLYEPRIKHTRSKFYFMNMSRFIKIKRKINKKSKYVKHNNVVRWRNHC